MPATDRALFLDDHSNRARGMGNNDELAKVAKRKARHVNFISPYTCRGRSYPHSDRSGQEQITMMQPYKGYFITGSALLVHPFSPHWYVGGSVLVPGRGSSIVEGYPLSVSAVHRKHQRTGGMVRAGGCAD